MVFSSTTFLLLFLPIVVLVYYNPVFKGRTFRNAFLFAASICFYAFGEPIFVFLMLFSIFVTWLLGIAVEKYTSRRRLFLILGITFHVSILFVFKYLTFVSNQLCLLLNCDSTVSIALPIGISFFTFQLMSYLFDVYYGKVSAQRNPLYVGLYVSLFPQLIAGPIVRYADIAYEIENRVEKREDFTAGFERFLFGLAKKILLANYLAVIADNVYIIFDSTSISVATAWLGSIAYTLQIYFDFSGYSDMAIGLGRMFGFNFLENFDYPYMATSVTDFWRRWHISLGSWFRDYVYIPLGGNRIGASRSVWNLLVVWMLTGIWHGANWTFLVWGLLYFVLLLIERLTGFQKHIGRFDHLYTLLFVNFGWVLFRSNSISDAIRFICTMFGANGAPLVDSVFTSYISGGYVVLLTAVFFCFPVYPWLGDRLKAKSLRLYNAVDTVIVTVTAVLAVVVAVSSTYNPFIYFNF